MERYENIVKIEEMRRLADKNQYDEAMKILETIDIGKIKALTDLSIIADVYMQNRHYEEAMAVLTRIYAKSKTRRVLYQLVDLSIKRGNAKEAEEYLEKYVNLAPDDASRFIFRYRIDKLNKEPYEILIKTLERLKEYEYHEQWAYELAKLYHKAGMKDKCVRECSDIILWFGEGPYVEKAKLLKSYYVGDIKTVHMLKAKEKKEAEKKLGLDKTKDYSEMKSRIERYLENEDTVSRDETLKEIDVKEIEPRDNYVKEDAVQTGTIMDKEVTDSIKSEEPAPSLNPDEAAESKQASETEITGMDETGRSETKMRQTSVQQTIENLEDIALEQSNDKENENPEINDPELEAFFKRIARKLEREIAGSIKTEEKDLTTDEENNEPAKEKAEIAFKNNEAETAEEKNELDAIFAGTDINYKKLFGYWAELKSTKKQMEGCLKEILSDYTKTGHLIITGENKSGKTTLAKKMTRALCELNRIHANRVAKISALRLNGLSLLAKKEKLTNCSLIIEKAGKMNKNTVTQLLSLMEDLNDKLYVILEDKEDGIEELLRNNPGLSQVFYYKISLPEYKTEDFIGFAVTYIENWDYEFTPDIKKAFESETERILSSVNPADRLEAVMNLAKKTKACADERNKAFLSHMIGNKELRPEDFVHICREDFLTKE